MPIKVELLTYSEYKSLAEKGMSENKGMFHYFKPGHAYPCPWHYDPTGLDPDCIKYGDSILSEHYWRDWADKRPPIIVFCPNMRQWMIDQKSSNGTGWVVTGYPGPITCSPSIVAGDYHSYLTNGYLQDDLEGRFYDQMGQQTTKERSYNT